MFHDVHFEAGLLLPWVPEAFHARFPVSVNRPLALRGHVTNVSFKQRVGILLMPKIDRAHKNYLTAEI